MNPSYRNYQEPRNKRTSFFFIDLDLLKRAFNRRPNKRIFRQFPLLSATHKVVDGALLGLALTVVVMSIISLHAQHLWTISFARLESSRALIQELKESISILERHFLFSQDLKHSMVDTKTSNLIYLNQPSTNSLLDRDNLNSQSLREVFLSYPIDQGY